MRNASRLAGSMRLSHSVPDTRILGIDAVSLLVHEQADCF